MSSPIVRIRVQPPYTPQDIEDELARLFASPDFEPGCDVLVEINGSQNSSSGSIRRSATLLSDLRGRFGSRVAIYTDNDLSYGLSRMFAVFAAPAGFEVAVFRDLAAAEKWALDGADEADESDRGEPPLAAGQS